MKKLKENEPSPSTVAIDVFMFILLLRDTPSKPCAYMVSTTDSLRKFQKDHTSEGRAAAVGIWLVQVCSNILKSLVFCSPFYVASTVDINKKTKPFYLLYIF